MTAEEMKEWIHVQLQLLSAADREERTGDGMDQPYSKASDAERAGMRIAFAKMLVEISVRAIATVAGVR
jgi:hypothetical protein